MSRELNANGAALFAGADLRLPQYRREVFLAFYQFHLKYRAHPGCVYYLIPFLRAKYGWDDEETLWFSFINGNTRNPVTSLILHRRAWKPSMGAQLIEHFAAMASSLDFDRDRRFDKMRLPAVVASYQALVGNNQRRFWESRARDGFAAMWKAATGIYTFGRLGGYSYLEDVRISGIDFDCDNLMLSDTGSYSHRNGLSILMGTHGYASKEAHKSTGFRAAEYPDWRIALMEREGLRLLAETKRRSAGTAWARDASFFTLESALCSYRAWHRPLGRYPNYYNDALVERIQRAQQQLPREDFGVFWEAREACLPEYLRLEASPNDLGAHPIKFNHYLERGEVVMMHKEYGWAQNDYNRRVDEGIGFDDYAERGGGQAIANGAA